MSTAKMPQKRHGALYRLAKKREIVLLLLSLIPPSLAKKRVRRIRHRRKAVPTEGRRRGHRRSRPNRRVL